ncbi:uncharacterized protein MONOS_17281 [Monocercomonoides exilis]|uniref:uncharacterized protein n=1 Tax=Monocercomonoides exilis TaxID=2049356 RepID=UPI00355A0224|nr:hypothetical protein MONOS_17281 [Monocercomonoides exilis]
MATFVGASIFGSSLVKDKSSLFSHPIVFFIALIFAFGIYLILVAVYRAFRCKDVPEAGPEIEEDVKRAKAFYKQKSLTF